MRPSCRHDRPQSQGEHLRVAEGAFADLGLSDPVSERIESPLQQAALARQDQSIRYANVI